MLTVKDTKTMGRGIYATEDIKRNTVVLRDHLLIIPSEDQNLVYETIIAYYQFDFKKNRSAIALGYASLLNHSKKPNCTWDIRPARKTIEVRTLKKVRAGEQLFIDYGYDPTSYDPFGLRFQTDIKTDSIFKYQK